MINITFVKLSDKVIFPDRMIHLISFRRKLEIYCLKNQIERKQKLVSELLIRKAAAEILGIPFQSVQIDLNRYGKPYLDNVRHFKFNISHSDCYIVLATGRYPLGIDIERVKSPDYHIAQRFFTENEYRYLRSFHKVNEAAFAFYKIWTRKEGFIKAVGKGLAIPLNKIETVSEDAAVYYCGQKQKQYQLFTMMFDGYVWSVVSQKETVNPNYRVIGENDFYTEIEHLIRLDKQ